jgi:hypothetical protein
MKDKIIGIWEKYRDEIIYEELKQNKCFANMFDIFESEVLYSLIRYTKPKKIIEMSPARGFTSFLMIEACKKNGNKVFIHSYDLVDFSRELDCVGDVSRKLVIGDAKKTLKPDDMRGCDFLFIDSDHSAEFAEWYCRNIIPRLRSEILIMIHDWNGYNHNGPEPAKVKEYCIGENPLCEPIINLMDYYEDNILMRKADLRGDRSPSQVLRKA